MPATFRTDPGFNGNQGQLALWDRVGALPDCGPGRQFVGGKKGCIRPVSGQQTWRDFGRPDIRTLPNEFFNDAPSRIDRSESVAQAIVAVTAAVGLGDSDRRRVATPVGDVLVTKPTIEYVVRQGGAREQYANFIVPTLENPFEIWAVDYGDHIRMRYLALFRSDKDEPVLGVVRENADGSILWNFMRKNLADMNVQRLGMMLWGR
jgi:hypothetical protein